MEKVKGEVGIDYRRVQEEYKLKGLCMIHRSSE